MELARQIDCQERARNDIVNAVEKHGWSYEAFNDMKYLDKCVAEGVRLHPSVSTIDRYTRKDYQVEFFHYTTIKNFVFNVFDQFLRYLVLRSP